jgi:hypothetical protein
MSYAGRLPRAVLCVSSRRVDRAPPRSTVRSAKGGAGEVGKISIASTFRRFTRDFASEKAPQQNLPYRRRARHGKTSARP